MANLFKKSFAVIMAIALVFTCLTVNAASEGTSINVSTGYATAADAKANTVTVELHTKNFSAVYGSDFTITLPAESNLTFVKNGDAYVVVNSGKNDWAENSNYVVGADSKSIRFLDVRTTKGFDFKVFVNVPAGTAADTYEINVVKGAFIDSYEADYSVKTTAGAVVVRATNTEVSGTTEGYFIPYGSVETETGSGVFVKKNEDGTFDSGAVAKSFKLPEASIGVTTFGASSRPADVDNGISKGIQLGSYAVNTAGRKYGTLMIMGDDAAVSGTYTQFRERYSNLSDEQIYNRLASLYFDANPADGTIKVNYKDSEGVSKYLIVGCVAQTKYMWRGTVNEVPHLQYAVRAVVDDATKATRTYTAIAYNYAENNAEDIASYVFSKEIKVDTKYKDPSAN